ncbi:hypothetical protein GC102_11400 [Paenibacillus sp. LMG 31460]|uniref:Uncharacterized protein n=1 Tax=Paenibacillus germinis TaxID=2654979 RepID=A0ABX1Z2Y5_9BACL|nr:hypothetical protein [Paenibacillus germinis]NOU86371.1 hypothetical protein [Paenibacillus germinis]
MMNVEMTVVRPFTRELDRMACFEFLAHQEAFARLHLAVEHRFLGVLTGEIGRMIPSCIPELQLA